jgi:CDP-diglyceride synthetase
MLSNLDFRQGFYKGMLVGGAVGGWFLIHLMVFLNQPFGIAVGFVCAAFSVFGLVFNQIKKDAK